MSFLANLRQQQSNNNSLKLIYLLEQQHHTLNLSLYIADIHNGTPSPDRKPYVLQAQHLDSPPAFIGAEDGEILRGLYQRERHPADGTIPGESQQERLQSQARLIAIAKTGRAFLQKTSTSGVKQLIRISLEQPISTVKITPHWEISPAGDQQLKWASNTNDRLLTFQQHSPIPSLAIRFSPESVAVLACEPECSPEAVIQVGHCVQVVANGEVALFYRQHRQTFTQLKLPLPQQLPRKTAKSRVHAVLHCSTETIRSNSQLVTVDTATLVFRYSSRNYCAVISAGDDSSLSFWNGKALVSMERDQQQEDTARVYLQDFFARQLSGFSSTQARKDCWQSEELKHWIELLIQKRKILKKASIDVHIAPNFSHQLVEVQHCKADLCRTSSDDIQLSLNFDLGDRSLSLREILAQLHDLNSGNDENYIRLADGRILIFARDSLVKLSDEFADVLNSINGSLCLPAAQISRLKRLEQHLPENTEWDDSDKLLPQAINIYRSPAVLDMTLSSVKATLRPYQWLGVCWLQHLSECGVNGLLADDMGLGKTLQTLAFLAFKKTQGALQKPALIVLPTSLIHNWAREASKFVPDLQISIMHGGQRHQLWESLSQQDLILTSYQLIANDSERWKTMAISWLILDEAQAIKNPQTQTSQAVRELHSDFRLCLSGTPVENHLGELWAVFDFLMPGCLGNRQSFNRHYRVPIEKQGKAQRMNDLLERIAPFMLRRDKNQVARDLPPKTLTSQYIELSEQQLQCYENCKLELQQSLEKQLEDTERGQQHILLLTAITTLRQICCDPALIGEDNTPSAKREFCVDTVRELVDENRAVLVFSQFTRMLDLLAEDFEEQNIPYLMLTGKTGNRQAVVDSFQKGDAPVLLMSLKAGGVGLNLTRADTVIHYDPWWNEAAERQATDRAHRIGQDKPVFVYKLIAEGTIEEKIARLQEYKATLSEQVSQQAKDSGKKFALELEDLLALINE